MSSRALSESSAANSLMSVPPIKARSPAPVTTTTRNSGSASSVCTASTISTISARSSALSFRALSIVSRARCPPSGRSSRATLTPIARFLRLEIAAFFVHSSRRRPNEARPKEADVDYIEEIADIREIYGEPMERTVKKQLPRLEKHSRAFIALSPFLVIASSDPSGRCDASPKGDAPGFVKVIDDETLLIPDRLGNNRVDTIGNLLSRPGVGLIFFVPGVNETLRVNGRARLITDPALLEPLAVNGKVPRSGIVVAAEEIYFHCGKALIRSDLWNPDKQLRRSEFPSLGRILADQIGGISVEESDRLTAESYKTRLY